MISVFIIIILVYVFFSRDKTKTGSLGFIIKWQDSSHTSFINQMPGKNAGHLLLQKDKALMAVCA